jgi:ribosomal protein L40E
MYGFNCGFSIFAKHAMWNSKQTAVVPCTECGAPLTAQAEACSKCGYPAVAPAPSNTDELESLRANLKEYKLLQVLGIVVAGGGLVAAMAESPLAAAISITTGLLTYLTGLFGIWWNRSD